MVRSVVSSVGTTNKASSNRTTGTVGLLKSSDQTESFRQKMLSVIPGSNQEMASQVKTAGAFANIRDKVTEAMMNIMAVDTHLVNSEEVNTTMSPAEYIGGSSEGQTKSKKTGPTVALSNDYESTLTNNEMEQNSAFIPQLAMDELGVKDAGKISLPDIKSEKITELLTTIEKLLLGKDSTKVEELSGYESLLLQLPKELLVEIKSFIQEFQQSDEGINVDQLDGNSNLIGTLLLMTTTTVEIEKAGNPSSHEEFTRLLLQAKNVIQEVMRVEYQNEKLTFSSNPGQTDSDILLGSQYLNESKDQRVIKVASQLVREIEGKLVSATQNFVDHSNKIQYLQAVHSRYFVVPKGISIGISLPDDPTEVVSNNKMTGNQVQGETVISTNDPFSYQISKAQQFTLFVDQSGKQLPNQEQFIRQFQNILAKGNLLNTGNGQQKLLIKLYPEHLGSLRIELLQSEGGLIAKIMASTSHAKEMVESHLSSLKHTFSLQNIPVEKIEISHQLQHQSERGLQRENDNQRQQPQHQYKQNDENESDDEESFVNALLDELINTKV